MNDDIARGETLHEALDALRAAVPMMPGLSDRVIRNRRRREHRAWAMRVTIVALVLIVGIVALRPLAGSGSAVTFALDAPQGHSVSLVGDFTDWQPDRVRLTQSRDGRWEVTVRLQPGRYRFAYVVNNRDWRPDDRAATVTDDFGRPTSILTVAAR